MYVVLIVVDFAVRILLDFFVLVATLEPRFRDTKTVLAIARTHFLLIKPSCGKLAMLKLINYVDSETRLDNTRDAH